MNFNKVCILENKTIDIFGYSPNELSSGSHKPIIVKCNSCDIVYSREHRNRNKRHQCSIVKDDKKRCFKCMKWKVFNKFSKNPTGSAGVAKLCKVCFQKQPCVILSDKKKLKRIKQSFKNDLSYYFKKRLSNFKSRAKKKKIPFNIDTSYLLELWLNQDGKCYYTNLEMNSSERVKGWQYWCSPSLDRRNPELGYTKGNVVWCITGVNSFKSYLTEEEFFAKLKKIEWRV